MATIRRDTLGYSLTKGTPSIQDLGQLVSDLLALQSDPLQIFENHSAITLEGIKVGAPSFRMAGTIHATRKDKEKGWHGDLINHAHILLRQKALQLNATFLKPENAFYRQLENTESYILPIDFKDDYNKMLTAIKDQITSTTESADHLRSFTQLLDEELRAVKQLEPNNQCVSLLFLWQRLLGQQRLFLLSKQAGFPGELQNSIHSLAHSPWAEMFSDALSFGIQDLSEATVSLINPESNQPFALTIPYEKGSLIGSPSHHPAMRIMTFFAGRMLVDQDKAPKPMREFLDNSGVTTQITEHWQTFNDKITQALQNQGFTLEQSQKIMEANGLILRQRDMLSIQDTAMQSLQELEFIGRIRNNVMPNPLFQKLITELSVFAGPQIRNAAPIAETPRQLLVLSKAILEEASAREAMDRFDRPLLTMLKDWLNMPKNHQSTKISSVSDLVTSADQTEDLKINALYRGQGEELLRPEKAKEIKTQVDKAVSTLSSKQHGALIGLLTMLSESLEANHTRYAEHSRGQSIA
jgi:hypothetical protein